MASKAIKSLGSVEKKLLRAAGGFKDYNFRHFFTQHVKEDFQKIDMKALEANPAAAEALLAAKKKELAQMQRMALINALYGKQKVLIDHDVPTHCKVVKHHHQTKEEDD